jgi:hypothetical protein
MSGSGKICREEPMCVCQDLAARDSNVTFDSRCAVCKFSLDPLCCDSQCGAGTYVTNQTVSSASAACTTVSLPFVFRIFFHATCG